MTCILKEIMIVFVELESVSLSDHLSFFFLALGRLVHHCVLFGARERKLFLSLRGVFTNLSGAFLTG